MKYREIHFKDDGQDALRWVVNEDNVIVDSQPFQYKIWKGKRLEAFSVRTGARPIWFEYDYPQSFSHEIIKITTPEKVYDFWKDPK